MSARRALAGYAFLLPAAMVYLPLALLPLAASVALSLHEWNGLAAHWTYVGLRQYRELLGDAIFWQALAHNLGLIVVSLAIQLPLALGLAVLLHRAGRLTGLGRTALFIPYVLPTVIIALVWQRLVVQWEPQFLASTTWSLPTCFVAICWRFLGFHLVLYLAGLATIDPELYAAAKLDGAGSWACFRHVTLPLLRPVLLVSATLAIVGSLKYFDIIYIMTGGGPAHSTELLATYLFTQSFAAQRYGYGSALATALVALALGGTALAAWVGRRGRRDA